MTKFNGDIVITDPCYIFSDEQRHAWEDAYENYVSELPVKKINKVRDEVALSVAKFNKDWLEYQLSETACDDKQWRDSLVKAIEKVKTLENDIVCVEVGDHTYPAVNFLSDHGFTDCMWGSTLYGDWQAAVFEKETKRCLGKFCADAGMWCVMCLDEVLNFNPDFSKFLIESPHTATIIRDFAGDVQHVIIEEAWHGKIDKSVEIHGGGNINFIARQVGL